MIIRNGKTFLCIERNFVIHLLRLAYFGTNISNAHKMWVENINIQKGENLMDHINKIELQGRIGTVRTNIFGDSMVANFSLVTEYLYKTRDGAANETTWHQITAWEGKDMPDLSILCKGMQVNVTGRLRTFRYTNTEGVEKQLYEVVASKVRIIEEEEER